MEKTVFEYLDTDYRYLNNYIRAINTNLFVEPKKAIQKERSYVENLTQEVAKLEGYGLLNGMTQFERLRKLESEGIFNYNIEKLFHMVRILENKAVGSDAKGKIEAALNINRSIYNITNWFVKSYVYPKFELVSYKDPIPQEGKIYAVNDDEIADIMKKQYDYRIMEINKLKEENIRKKC